MTNNMTINVGNSHPTEYKECDIFNNVKARKLRVEYCRGCLNIGTDCKRSKQSNYCYTKMAEAVKVMLPIIEDKPYLIRLSSFDNETLVKLSKLMRVVIKTNSSNDEIIKVISDSKLEKLIIGINSLCSKHIISIEYRDYFIEGMSEELKEQYNEVLKYLKENFSSVYRDEFKFSSEDISDTVESLEELSNTFNDFKSSNINYIIQTKIPEKWRFKFLLRFQRFNNNSKNNIINIIKGFDITNYKGNETTIMLYKKYGVNTDVWFNYNKINKFNIFMEKLSFVEKSSIPIRRIKLELDHIIEELDDVLHSQTENAIIKNDKYYEIKNQLSKCSSDKGKKSLEKSLINTKEYSELSDLVRNYKFRLSEISKLIELKSDIKFNENKFKDNLKRRLTVIEDIITNMIVTNSKISDKCIELECSGLTNGEQSFVNFMRKTEESRIHILDDSDSIYDLINKEDIPNVNMEIKIAPRDINSMFLGNYCPCCISAERGNPEDESISTIAQYITDPGMQNIVVYDADKGIPIAVCWLFIGEEQRTEGKPILVVDNIECNTSYSSQYKHTMIKEIKCYIEEYAKECGIENIIQGPYNNDLIAFKVGTVEHKLCGYNNKEPYYLEAIRECYEDEDELEIEVDEDDDENEDDDEEDYDDYTEDEDD